MLYLYINMLPTLNKNYLLKLLQRLFLIYAPVNHIGILQRQFDDGSCFHSAQNLTKRIFLKKNMYLIFIETLLNVLSLSDCRTTGPSDYRDVGL